MAPSILFGASNAFIRPAFTTLVAELAPVSHRSKAFVANHALKNVGIGAGALLAGFLVVSDSSASFVGVFLFGTASYLAFAILLWVFVPKDADRTLPGTWASAKSLSLFDGYRTALADRRLVGALIVNTLLTVFAFGQVNSSFPIWATDVVGVPMSVVGSAVAVNTVIIFVGQALLMRVVTGRSRTRMIAGAACLFGTSWLVVLAAPYISPPLASLALIGSMGIFAVGEVLLAPSIEALVNDLAPDKLRGRFNAIFATSWQVGPIAGPALAGLAFGLDFGIGFLVILASACVVAGALAMWLGRLLPPEADYGHP